MRWKSFCAAKDLLALFSVSTMKDICWSLV